MENKEIAQQSEVASESVKAEKKLGPAKELRKYLQSIIPSFTEGQFKIFTMFDDLQRNEIFLDGVKEIRDSYKIKPEKFKEKQKIQSAKQPGFGEWGTYTHFSDKQKAEITKKISTLCNRVGLDDHPNIHRPVRYYLFYDWFPLPELNFDTCVIRTMGGRRSKILNKQELSDLKYYPIAILISPYASGREIVDFVKRYPHIESMQEQFRKPNALINKTRLKDPDKLEIRDFIWKHRKKPRREIAAMIAAKFGVPKSSLDYTYIAKIISLEKKGRKEV